MPTYDFTKSYSLGGRKGLIVVIIFIVVLGGGFTYARLHGLNLHIQSGSVSSTHFHATDYLDGQTYITGTITDTGLGNHLIKTDDAVIDLGPIYTTVNRSQPVDHFITGSIVDGAQFKALVQKTDTKYPAAYGFINETYQVLPLDPFYLTVTAPPSK